MWWKQTDVFYRKRGSIRSWYGIKKGTQSDKKNLKNRGHHNRTSLSCQSMGVPSLGVSPRSCLIGCRFCRIQQLTLSLTRESMNILLLSSLIFTDCLLNRNTHCGFKCLYCIAPSYLIDVLLLIKRIVYKILLVILNVYIVLLHPIWLTYYY